MAELLAPLSAQFVYLRYNRRRTRDRYAAKILIAYLAVALAFGAGAVHAPLEGQPIGKYPKFEVDPSWPKQLPNNMIMGDPAGVAVDTNDHVWI